MPLGHELLVALRAHHAASEWPRDSDLVFCTRTGTPFEYSNLHAGALVPARDELGEAWVGFHTLRHEALRGGRSAVQVQRWLGHHSPAFTLSVYVHLLDGDLGNPLPEPTMGPAKGQQATPKPTETPVARKAAIPHSEANPSGGPKAA